MGSFFKFIKKMKKILFFWFITICTVTLSAQEAYYNDVDLTAEGIALKENLATKIIATHTKFLSYTPDVWNACKATDVNPTNSSEVLLVYGFSTSGMTSRTRGINDNSGNTGDWNREHTYAQSLGTPNLGNSAGPGVDAHHLRASDVTYNGNRGSLKFAAGFGNSGPVNGGWYPGDEWKGDVARMMMYMYLHYGDQCKPTGVGIGNDSSTPDDMIDLFLVWNKEDPVSDFERQRNTYHENTANSAAQGNRNPFIDNAYLATRIWGGDAAIDSWGIYTSSDSEAPSVPTAISASSINFNSFDISWNASTDNEAVTGYDIFVDGTLNGNSANTSYSIANLTQNTMYSITVLAKDIANNKSEQSVAINVTTLQDATAPSTPTNIMITNQTGSSFKVSWDVATDNSGVTSYDVYLDGSLKGSTAVTNYEITGLNASTTYSVSILAKDQANNSSPLSTAVSATTTDGSTNDVDLFFSEYIEGSGFNKALEIANISNNTADLTPYSIQRQSGGVWEQKLSLSGSIAPGDVYVIINSDAEIATILAEADLGIPNTTPMTFNGDDRIGLFKNDVLVDIIGDLDGTSEFAKNITLRRNTDITKPNTTYSEQGEWTSFGENNVDDLGKFVSAATASIDDAIFSNIKMYPNPVNGNTFSISSTEKTAIIIYNLLGKVVKKATITADNNLIDISNLAKGIYSVKMNINNATASKKLIKN
jgi:endonuclease I